MPNYPSRQQRINCCAILHIIKYSIKSPSINQQCICFTEVTLKFSYLVWCMHKQNQTST